MVLVLVLAFERVHKYNKNLEEVGNMQLFTNDH